MKINKIQLLLIFILLCNSLLFAEKITFSANSLTGTIGDKSDSTTLSGEAYVLTDTMEISADSISMSGKDFRYIEASGKIKGKNMESELEFTCEKMLYDRETKIAKLSQDVTLIDEKNDVNAKAQLIEYNQNTDIAVIQINIELKQKDNVCKGAYAIYRKKEQKLELSGNAQIKQGEDTFRAQEITLDLDSQEITLDGRVKGSVVDERKSAEKPNEEKKTEDKIESEEIKKSEDKEKTPENLPPPPDTENQQEKDKKDE
ncbi:MAG: LPS export ABC transporter periplasmic protein LptC [Treponema sp.]|nr:LPS export ABC transporter periplasmic protein LptC [Treponema sp.]